MKTFNSIILVGLFSMALTFLSAQNAPISTIGNIETYNDSVQIAITVTDFTNIGACDLKIVYDSTVAKATSVELGPGVSAFFFVTSVDTIGKIYVSWLFFQYGVPGLTLTDSSVFLTISFERLNYGFTSVEFDNSSPDNCLFTDENFDILNDIPNSTYYLDGFISFNMVDAPFTSAANIEACGGIEPVDIPISVYDFNQIGAFNLTLEYDPLSLIYASFTNNSDFPELEIVESTPGVIVAGGISTAAGGVSLSNNAVLFTLHFNPQEGSSDISWLDDGASCLYSGPAPDYEPRNDDPQSTFYVDGMFTELPLPANAGNISGPAGGVVCQGETGVIFSVLPIENADSYVWTLPDGASIDTGEGTPEISVSFNEMAISGSVNVYGVNECGIGIISPDFSVTVEESPAIINQPISPDTVYAGNGIADFTVEASGADLSFQWQEYTGSWADISEGGFYAGVLTSTLTVTDPIISMNGNKYRCVISGLCEPLAITDGTATLTVVINTEVDTYGFSRFDANNPLNFKVFPNPFSDQISFSYTTPSPGIITIAIYDILGIQVEFYSKEIEYEGAYADIFDLKLLKQGIYNATITFINEESRIRNNLIIIARSD